MGGRPRGTSERSSMVFTYQRMVQSCSAFFPSDWTKKPTHPVAEEEMIDLASDAPRTELAAEKAFNGNRKDSGPLQQRSAQGSTRIIRILDHSLG